MNNVGQVEILLVEDNPIDAEMMIRTLKKDHLLIKLHWVKDGQEALDFLFYAGTYENRKELRPGLILLDIRMPKVSGIEVLRAIKSDPHLRRIPVVIMSASSEDPDIAEAYRLGVNSYVVKSINFDAFAASVAKVGNYWITANHRAVSGG